MSMAALRWVRPIRCTPTQKAVLWALADQADDAGEAWPSVAGLMEATCLSERSVRGALRELEALGWLRTSAGGGRNRTSTYHLAVDRNGAADAETRQQAPRIRPAEKGQRVPEKGHVLPERGQVVQEKGQQVPPNPHNPHEPPRTLTLIAPVVREPDAFEAWWRHYPRKVGKDAARTAYAAARKRGATDAELAAALQRQRWPSDPQFIPHARTWLTQGRWQDDPTAAAPPASAPAERDNFAWLRDDPGPQPLPFDLDLTAERMP